MSDASQAVELDGVWKTYQLGEQTVDALRDVSLTLSRGSYTAVMGPSGSGKSTLMNLVGCLDTPTEGRVDVDGRDVTALSERERTRLRGREIGFVFQTFNLMPRLTAAENVALPMVFQDVPGATARTAPATCWAASASATGRTTARASSPAVSASASPSPARSLTTRRCCSRTSRPGTSTRRLASGSWTCSRNSTRPATPSSW